MLFILGFVATGLQAQKVKKVLLAVNADNPDYGNARNTFREGLETEGRKAGLDVKFTVLDTKGDKDAFMAKLKEMEPTIDLIFVPGTPNAMAVKQAGITKPVIFTAIANPVGAKLVNSLDAPGTNFTGGHCAVPEDKQLRALLMVLPKVKKIGILYNPDDPAPASQAKKWKDAIAAQVLEAVDFSIPATTKSADELAEATKPMVGKVDVIVTTQDAKVSPYGEGMTRIANENKVPTYVSLGQLVNKGALVSLGYNFVEGAKLNVTQAIQILNGRSPADIAVTTFPEYRLVVNSKTAKAIGVEIPLKALKMASEVVQ
jgi:putative ABC transport system substrate-binding protein